jgi:hypothetical protein
MTNSGSSTIVPVGDIHGELDALQARRAAGGAATPSRAVMTTASAARFSVSIVRMSPPGSAA